VTAAQPAAPLFDPVADYAVKVDQGQIIAGPHVRKACRRHLRDMVDAGGRGWRFDLDLAYYYLDFIEMFLCLNGGEFEGRPFMLEPWQKFIVGSLFGWVEAATRVRRFRTAFIEIGKGNGKSPLAAAIGLVGLVADGEARAEVYAAATKKDQAMILFRDAVAMVDQSPLLRDHIKKSGTGEKVWNLAYIAGGAFFRPIASDDGQSGPRPHISLVDEVHEHKDGRVLDMLRRGFKGRRQPLLIEITNSGTDRNSICWLHHEMSTGVVDARPGEVGFDDRWFSYVCSLDQDDDWRTDESCWIKANPNLGVSMPYTTLRDAVQEARNMPSKAGLIARLHFCVWTQAESAWVGAEPWLESEDTSFDLTEYSGRDVVIGLDLSKRLDLTAAAFYFPGGEYEKDALHVEVFTPADTLERRATVDKVDYASWVAQGFLTATPGSSIVYTQVVERIVELVKTLDLNVVGLFYDRWRIDDFKTAMQEVGVEDWELHGFGQGFKDMGPAVEALETGLLQSRLRIHYNPALRWAAQSAVVVEDPAGNRKFEKSKATGRIDSLVACAIAVGGANKAPAPAQYDVLVF